MMVKAIRNLFLFPIALLMTITTQGCRTNTVYLDSPYALPNSPSDWAFIAKAESACLDFDKLKMLVGRGKQHGDLPWLIFAPEKPRTEKEHPDLEKKLLDAIRANLERVDPYLRFSCGPLAENMRLREVLEKTGAGQKAAAHLTEYGQKDLLEGTNFPREATARWAYLLGEVLEHHQGMRLRPLGTSSQESVERRRRKEFNGLGVLLSTLFMWDRISLSSDEPVALSLSTRNLDGVKVSPFSSFPERTQKGLVNFGGQFTSNWKDKTPSEALQELMKAVTHTDSVFSRTQKIELTISSAVNTAEVDDRLDYVSAYLIIPPFPTMTNQFFDLEGRLLQRIRAYTMGRIPRLRQDRIDGDIHRALMDLSVRFESVENIQTRLATLDLGTVQNTFGTTAGVSAPTGLPVVPTISSNLQGVRTDKLLKEIDRRSVWLAPERNAIRITQRGHGAVSVAGTITESLSLRIPERDMLVVQVKETKADASADVKQKKVKLSARNIGQPMYAAVDGLAVLIGTARMAIPAINPFKSEPNGYSMTILHGPYWIRLWENDSQIPQVRFDARGLFDHLEGKPKGKLAVMVETNGVRDFFRFGDDNSAQVFWQRLGSSIGLQKVKDSSPGDWFRVVVCNSGDGQIPPAEIDPKQLDPDDILLGVQDFDGTVRGFLPDEYQEGNVSKVPTCRAQPTVGAETKE